MAGKRKKASPRGSRSARSKEATRSKRTSAQSGDQWNMRLYVAGQSARSLAAIANLRKICDAHLPPGFTFEVIDLMSHPELAKSDQIIAVPTLIRRLPAPIRRIIGDLSVTEKVLMTLELAPA